MSYEELKIGLLDDLKICITYEPSKEDDLLCMMEQYLNTDEKRSDLLTQIKNCMDGKPYQNPFSMYYFYNQDDITKLTQIIDNYIYDMKDTENAYATMSNTICKIGDLHDKCGGELIDEYRKPMLAEFLLRVAEFTNFESARVVLKFQTRW